MSKPRIFLGSSAQQQKLVDELARGLGMRLQIDLVDA